MLVALCVVGALISGSLAYSRLVKGELSVSKSKELTGITARVIGVCCLAFATLLVVFAAALLGLFRQ